MRAAPLPSCLGHSLCRSAPPSPLFRRLPAAEIPFWLCFFGWKSVFLCLSAVALLYFLSHISLLLLHLFTVPVLSLLFTFSYHQTRFSAVLQPLVTPRLTWRTGLCLLSQTIYNQPITASPSLFSSLLFSSTFHPLILFFSCYLHLLYLLILHLIRSFSDIRLRSASIYLRKTTYRLSISSATILVYL